MTMYVSDKYKEQRKYDSQQSYQYIIIIIKISLYLLHVHAASRLFLIFIKIS